MEINIPNNKLRRAATDKKAATKQYGPQMATKLHLRMADLKAANTLEDFWPPKSGPQRCHELSGNMEGKFTVDLVHPYRIVFEPVEVKPAKDRSDEQARWAEIKEITITSIEDTHE